MMDCTQILDDLAFDEPKEIKDDKKIQFGSLEIGDKSYPIYKGENRIGRDSVACSVVIDSKALSKEHAVIDVADFENHHLYDLGSTNKTRMGKLVLQPFIRYNIQDHATIMFADISATYQKCNDIGESSPMDDSKSSSTEELEDTVNDLDTQMECHFEDGKQKLTETNNIFADNIYDAPTQCEDFESDTLNESSKALTSLTTSVPLHSNDTNENKSVTNEPESTTVLRDQSYDRSLLEGDEDMFQMSVSESDENKGAEERKPVGSEPVCNQQEEKKESDCQQSESTLSSTAVQSSVPCAEKSFTLDFSSGDETDPEDIFCAQTQQFPVSKKNLETANMVGTVFSKQTVSLSADKSKGSDAVVVEDKKVENTSVILTHDTSVNEQQVKGNCVQNNFSNRSIKNTAPTLPLQENEKRQNSDSTSKEVVSGDETDPEELFCAPTQKFFTNKGKSSPDKTADNDLEDLCGAPTQKFVSTDNKKAHDCHINVPQRETECQPPKLSYTSPKQVEPTVHGQSEQINEMDTDLSDTTFEDVICPATQESRRITAELEINETPERDVLVKGKSGLKPVVEEGTSAADVLKKQKNENNRKQSDLNSDELFCAPTQKIEDFYDLSKFNKTDRTKIHSEKEECEKHPKLVAEDKRTASPELMKESLQSNVVKVANKLDVCSDIYSQPTQRFGEWNEEQKSHGNRDSVCNRSKINLEKEMDLQELFSQPTQKFCGSRSKEKITNKQKCSVQETDARNLLKEPSKKTCENKPGTASPSVLVFENVKEGSSDVCDIVHIRETCDSNDIFSCPTQKLDAGLIEKNETGLAVQLPDVCNKSEKDIFSADTQNFPPETVDSLKTVSGRILNPLTESGSKGVHLQHSTKGGMDGLDDSLSGEDEEVIKIFSKNIDSNCELGKHTKNTTKQDNECSTARVCLKNIVDNTTEYREKDEDSLEMELHLPQSQEVIAAFKELENKAALKTIYEDGSGNVDNNFSSPVIPRKRKSKTTGERKHDTNQESHVSETIKPLCETPKCSSSSLVCDLEADSSEKRKVRRQFKDEHVKKDHNVQAVQSTVVASSSEEQSELKTLHDSRDSGSRRSVRERKKTWKLTETTDSTSPGHNKIVEKATNRISHRKTFQSKLPGSVPETSTEKTPGKRHSRLKKHLITADCNIGSDSEAKNDSKKCFLKNIGTQDDKPAVSCDNKQENNCYGSTSKNLGELNQEQTTDCDKNDSSVSVYFQKLECKTASKFQEPLEESKQASGRTRRSRITSVSKKSEGGRFQEDQMQNVAKSHVTRLRNPNRDKRVSSDENRLEVENIGLKPRKSKHNGSASTSEVSVNSSNHKQATSKHVIEKINSNEDDESCVRLSDHQKESQNNEVPIPQMDQKGDTCVVPENVEGSSSVEKRASKRKLDKISSRRSRNTKDTNLRSVSPIDKVQKNQNISLDADDAKEAPPPNKKRKVIHSNVENNEPLRKDILKENCSREEDHDVKTVRMPRGRKTDTGQSKSVTDITKNKNTKGETDSPNSQQYKNIPATTRKRRGVSEKTTNAVSENELQNPSTRQEKVVSEYGKTTKHDSPVKKTKTSLPLSPNESVESVQHKDSTASSTENNEKSPRASHRLSARPTKTTHQVLFTGLNDARLQTTVQNLGGKIMEKPEDCNVLVTDKVRRTYKFLCVMGQGKPIVSPEWLLKSQKSGRFLDPWEFLLNDKENETKFKFSLKKSLMQCEKAKLLTDFSVAVTPSVKPPPQEMKGIIESCGGTFIEAIKKFPGNSFIISCNEDRHMWSKLKKLGTPVVGAEAILLGVLQQKLNLSSYALI